MNYLEILFKVTNQENEKLLSLYKEKDFALQDNFEKRKKIGQANTTNDLDSLLDLCDDSSHAANTLISILEKAVFAVNTEIKNIKKNINHMELIEDAAYDAANSDKKTSKTEYEKSKKFYITTKIFDLVCELEDKKIIQEFGELELKRMTRIKTEFEEFNMNVKKKYQFMV